MTETATKPRSVDDIIKETGGMNCPVRRSVYVVKEFLAEPMCGRCFPCSMGSYEARLRLEALADGSGSAGDVAAVENIATMMQAMSMCKKGKDVAAYLLGAIKEAGFIEHASGVCPPKECPDLIEYRITPGACILCGDCQDACKFDAILGEKKKSVKCCFLPFEIRQKRCVKCGECIKVCPTNAISIVNIDTKKPVTT